jgi:ubiquinone/menaquinone biosynthesis C-methylase UbiE
MPDMTDYKHRFTRFTDALIPVYNWVFNVLAGRKHAEFRQHVVDLASLSGNEIVLDGGCGTGLMLKCIARMYPNCAMFGIDISPKMLASTQENAEKHGLALNLQLGSITRLPYANATFDVVISNIMFHHLDLVEKEQAVYEIARLLKVGGRYVSAEFGPRARNPLQRRLAKGEYTLYPSHLIEAGLKIELEELKPFAWGKKLFYRVAVKELGEKRVEVDDTNGQHP